MYLCFLLFFSFLYLLGFFLQRTMFTSGYSSGLNLRRPHAGFLSEWLSKIWFMETTLFIPLASGRSILLPEFRKTRNPITKWPHDPWATNQPFQMESKQSHIPQTPQVPHSLLKAFTFRLSRTKLSLPSLNSVNTVNSENSLLQSPLLDHLRTQKQTE